MRQNFRNWRNRIVKGFGDEGVIRCYAQVKDVDRALEDVNRIALNTYQHRMGVGFQYNDDTRSKWQLLAKDGILKIYVLYFDGKPCAFENIYHYKNVYYGIETGHDPDYKLYRPGMYLIVKVVEQACLDPECEALDWGFGDAYYKQVLGNETWIESCVNIYAPTLRGQWIKVLQFITTSASQITRKILLRLKVFDRIKRLWRRRLASG